MCMEDGDEGGGSGGGATAAADATPPILVAVSVVGVVDVTMGEGGA